MLQYQHNSPRCCTGKFRKRSFFLILERPLWKGCSHCTSCVLVAGHTLGRREGVSGMCKTGDGKARDRRQGGQAEWACGSTLLCCEKRVPRCTQGISLILLVQLKPPALVHQSLESWKVSGHFPPKACRFFGRNPYRKLDSRKQGLAATPFSSHKPFVQTPH